MESRKEHLKPNIKGSQLREYAASGVHGAAAEILARYVPKSALVLELGAGAGAFSQRLRGAGYRVVASDLDPVGFAAAGIPFAVCDLDDQWPEDLRDARPDAICAIEVIEHLKSPWKLLGDCSAVLSPGGVLVVSTPNISSAWGRTYFLLQGIPLGFSKRNMLAIGHINPLTFQEVAYIAECMGFEVIERLPAGEFEVTGGSRIGDFLKKNLFCALCVLLRPLMRKLESGSCHVIVLKKR
jgi:SAM-dependent methyltransferase